MRRLLGLILTLFSAISIFGNMQGHFFMNVENESIQVSNVESKFALWLDLPSNTTFALFRDETDALGIRHLSYQQYVNGVEILHGIVLVHAKNNLVFAINGDIMDATIAAQQLPQRISPLKAAQKVRKSAESSEASLKIVRAYINGKTVYRYAYEVLSEDYSDLKYIDAESGEIIKVVPLKYNADVTGTVTTMYNGTQIITCYESEGVYYLFDEGRGIYTLDATNNTYKINYENNNITEELMNAIDASSVITNNSPSWTSSWDFKLKSIKISAVVQNSSWYTIGEGQADLYIKIKDANNNLLYKSGYKDDPTLPTTFNITTDIFYASLPLSVELWDYDPVGDDDYIDGFIMDTYGGNMYEMGWTAISEYAQGSYTAIASGLQPHFDAHWGMEKTLDFYNQKLHRNSYDNQGSTVYQVVNLPKDEVALADFPLNAFAVKMDPFPMVYGTGLLSTNSALSDACVRPLVSIDIMAHEFTHLVTEKNGNGGLVYAGEAGALNESFSDIIGIAVKEYATGSNDWLIGSDVVVNASNMRSMKNPNNSYDGRVGIVSAPQPKTYNDNKYWKDPLDTECKTCDHGGVHSNSGVQNYWFYLLSEGGSGTNDIGNNYSVTGIGIDKAVQIAYRNLIYYLTPEATHEDARNGSIQAAIDLYGRDSQEHQSVMNSWHAVGVGNAYAPESEITISAKMPNDWGTTITAWTWQDGSEGEWATLVKAGEWYSYTTTVNPLNIVFVNGSTWNGDNNQSIDIRLTESACIELGTNMGKRTYTLISCEEEPETDNYVILAQRNATDNWYYMTSDLGTAANKRYQAVDAGTNSLANVNTSNLESKYYWQIEENKLHTAAGYSAWISGNTAILDETGKDLNIEKQTDGTYTFSFADGTNTRYLALNKTAGNNYFAYYSGTNQIYKLTLVKEGESGTTTAIEEIKSQQELQSATKILRDGQIFILRGEKVCTITGQKVK